MLLPIVWRVSTLLDMSKYLEACYSGLCVFGTLISIIHNISLGFFNKKHFIEFVE